MYIDTFTGVILGVAPKCASTSIRGRYHHPGLEPLTNNAVSELKKSHYKVVGLVRDPIERCQSAYNFFKYKNNGAFPKKRSFENIDHFVNSLLAGHSDDHWLPQTEVLTLCDSWADLESFPIGVKLNISDHVEKLSGSAKLKLKEYYECDYAVRGNKWRS